MKNDIREYSEKIVSNYATRRSLKSELRNNFALGDTKAVNERIASRSMHPEDFESDSESELIEEIVEVERSIKRFKTDRDKAESRLKKIETASKPSVGSGVDESENVSASSVNDSEDVTASTTVGTERRR